MVRSPAKALQLSVGMHRGDVGTCNRRSN
jgi:hypothetical protein